MRRWRNDLTLDAVIVRPEKAEQEKKSGAEIPGGTGSGFTGGSTGYTGSGGGSWDMTGKESETGYSGKGGEVSILPGADESGQTASAKVKRVSIKATVPWDKLSQIVTGVIRPLKASGRDPEIIIEVKAESESGFDRTTLDSKVKETLQQVGAVIAEWKES